MKEKAQRQMIPKYIIFILIILILGICSNCIYAKERVQPEFKVRLVFADGQPAVGVTARVKQIIVDQNNKQGRYYPDKKTKSWWQNAALGSKKTNGPSSQDGSIIIQGAGARKQEEHILAIRDLEPQEKAAYEIEWSGGLAAAEKKIYDIDTFPNIIELKRGVEVILERHGPALDLSPVVVRQAKAWVAVSKRSSYPVVVEEIAVGKWKCILEEDISYVIGYPEAHHKEELRKPQNDRRDVFRGFVSEPFVAQTGKKVTFTPGLPCKVTADFSNVPKTSPIFPCTIDLYRKTKLDECKQDARVLPYNIKLHAPQSLTWNRVAPGAYYVRIFVTNRIYGTRDSFGEIHYPITLASGEKQSLLIDVLKVDQEVLPGDIAVSGYLKDSQDEPIVNCKMVLVPVLGDRQFGLVSYPAVRTNKEGFFQFDGVTPKCRYNIGFERTNGSFGSYSVNPKVLGVEDYVFNINDFTTNATAETFTLDKFIFESKNKKQISIKDFKGKIVVVDFWATWCSPCIRDMPAYLSLAEKLKDNDKIVFLAISVDSERILWKKMIEEKPWQILKHGWFNPVTNHGQLKKPIPYKVVYDTAGHILGQGKGINLEDILTKLNILPLRLKTTEQNK